MRDQKRRLLGVESLQRLQYLALVLRVQTRGRLVENQNRRPPDRRTGDSETLALTMRKRNAAFAKNRVVALRQRGDKLVRVGESRGGEDLLARRARRGAGDVVADAGGEQHVVLEHDADLRAQRFERELADVAPVNQQAPALRVVEPEHEAQQGGLAAARRADQRDVLAGLHVEMDFFQQVLPALVGESDAVELDAAGEGRRPHGTRQVTHVGDAFEQIDHAFAGGGGFAETAGVFGEVLYRAVGGLEVCEEQVKVARADFEHVHGTFERGGEAFAFHVLPEIFFAHLGEGAGEAFFERQGLDGFDGVEGFGELRGERAFLPALSFGHFAEAPAERNAAQPK